MTMVHKLRSQAPRLARVASAMIVVVLVGMSCAASLEAEAPPVHYHHAGIMPPGAIGREQLLRGGPLPGYFQPVEIKAPPGASISTALDGQFEPPRNKPLLAGMLIGSVYRLRVTDIPQQEGMEVYPTVELIDRIYPPVGQEFRFPIPIELTQEELEMALAGKFVTRVIYLEEPAAALPVVENPKGQSYFEAAEGDNPLEVADSLGRPMAILRMGARVPGVAGPDETFMYGSPPLLKWKPAAVPVLADNPLQRAGNVKQTGATSRARKPIWRGPTTP
jgi:hypothetical protein